MNKTYSPIALFTYNRVEHSKIAVKTLLDNPEAKNTDIYIYSDGPKNESDVYKVSENRNFLRTVSGFRSVTLIEKEFNCGLSNSLINGITDIVNKYGRVIVVEDDLSVSPFFLKFMNDALEYYKNEEKVSAISGYVNPVDTKMPEMFFLRYFSCWGWATWKRAWDLFNPDSLDLLFRIRKTWKTNEFNIGNSKNFYNMLLNKALGKNDSWAIRFYASSFLNNKLILFPGKSLVDQNGYDGTGTHCSTGGFPAAHMAQQPININMSLQISESQEAFLAYQKFFKSREKEWSTFFIAKSFIKRILYIDIIKAKYHK